MSKLTVGFLILLKKRSLVAWLFLFSTFYFLVFSSSVADPLAGPSTEKPQARTQSPAIQLEKDNSNNSSAKKFRGVRALKIPVYWQVIRSKFNTTKATTLSETYREVWTLELRPDWLNTLSSPRAKVNVYGISEVGDNEVFPPRLTLTEAEFAKLLGLSHAVDGAQVASPSQEVPALISIKLTAPPRGGQDFTLSLSEDEHAEIHLELGK